MQIEGPSHDSKKETSMTDTESTLAPPADGSPSQTFTVHDHHSNPRIKVVTLQPHLVAAFVNDVAHIEIQSLDFVPFRRFELSDKMISRFGSALPAALYTILTDRATGSLTVSIAEHTLDPDDFVRLATAFSHLIGLPNHDAMSGNYYARFVVEDTGESDSYLRQAYRTLPLHTDGTYTSENTDWLLMMKMAERDVEGGMTRLLHLDDWSEIRAYRDDPYGRAQFEFRAPPSKNVDQELERPIFFHGPYGVSMSYIDQFIQPKSLPEARYLQRLSDSLETSEGVTAVELPPGHLVMINNHFWLHGRAAFEPRINLRRELLRQRGTFKSDEFPL